MPPRAGKLLTGSARSTSVRASHHGPVEVMALDAATFDSLVSQSDYVRAQFAHLVRARAARHHRTLAKS